MFTGRNALEIAAGTVRARHVVAGMGRRAGRAEHFRGDACGDDEGVFSSEALPARVVLMGGGYIAAKFLHIAALASVKVTVRQHSDRMLNNFDSELIGGLFENPAARASICRREAAPSASKSGTGYQLRRHAAVVAGIVVRNGRLKLDEFLQSVSNPAIHTAGDAMQIGPPLTPVSSHAAKVAAQGSLRVG